MVVNDSISFGDITSPVVDTLAKVDVATGGWYTLFIHALVFLLIFSAFYKKYNNFEKGMAAAGFVTSILGGFLTVIGVLSWSYIWISVSLFVIGFVFKNFE